MSYRWKESLFFGSGKRKRLPEHIVDGILRDDSGE